MSQVELQEPEAEEQPAAEGTEGTEYEGMSEEEVERAEFDRVVKEDTDIEAADEKPAEEEPAEEPAEEPVAKEERAAEPPVVPTGLEWLDNLSDEDRSTATNFIHRQGQTIARLDQRVASHLGQLQPAQKLITVQVKKIRQMEEQAAQQQPEATIDIKKRISDYDDWVEKEYAEFPEEAAKLKTQFAESLDGITEVLEAAAPAPRPTEVAGPDQRDEVNHLATAYSDWGERRYSPEFQQWLGKQAPEKQQMLNSSYASDNIMLLDAFTRDNPNWVAPQSPEQFHSLRQAQYSPLFRGWAEGEGINPDFEVAGMPDFQRDELLTRFKTDLGTVVAEISTEQGPANPAPAQPVSQLKKRRREQLQNRDPGSRRRGVKPGQKIDLNTEEGQRAYFDQLINEDADLK